MAVRAIRLFGDPVLRRQCEPVAGMDDEAKGILRDLVESVDGAQGLGLAAPQIGVARRLIVVVEPGENGERTHYALANPEITNACGEEVGEEGCLSIPGIYSNVKRPRSVVVKGMDAQGRNVTLEASGLMARAFCHEIDHLDGILFVDRIGMVKRGLLKRRLDEIKKEARKVADSA
jgi:peptide deformylase